MTTPLVSCLCATYSRPKLLGEAVQCFIDQDYENKELIVLNDQVGVELCLDNCPDNIKIYNNTFRFNSLGEKRNYLKSMGRGDLFCIWDDDDLYLKHRISKSVQLMRDNAGRFDIVKPKFAYLSTSNKNYELAQNLFHSQACITKDYMLRNNYLSISVGEDMAFENKARIGSFDVDPFYVYRWGAPSGVNIHHLSGIANEKESWGRSLTYYPSYQGRVQIVPKLYDDYWAKISAFRDKKNK